MPNFGQNWPLQISSSLFAPKWFENFGTLNFGHSKFLPVFSIKMVQKILEWPIFAKIVDCYFFKNYFVQKDWEKIGMANFGQNCAF